MAGDWIKMRTNLLTDPAIVVLTKSTTLDEFAVIGRLHTLWSWADEHTRNGYAPGVTRKWLDKFLRYDGFCDALERVGWLCVENAGVRLPKFDKHNGQTAKTRAHTRSRAGAKRFGDGDARGVRAADKAQRSKRPGRPIARETPLLAELHPVPPVALTSSTEKKRRVRKRTVGSESEFDLFWNSYPSRRGRKLGKQKCSHLFSSLPRDDQLLATTAAKNYAASDEAQHGFARDPERFLKADWWRDWLGPPQPEERMPRVATAEELANWTPFGVRGNA
ncbi:MAG TPA: hypothetical protein VHC22_32690 [Pirellulales bacterium]|nr:hypothetical protein [Pirellulales bacterium]